MKVINAVIKVIDYVALFIAFVMGVVLVLTFLVIILRGALLALWHEIRTFGPLNNADTVAFTIIFASFVWCAVRWKQLNMKPSGKR